MAGAVMLKRADDADGNNGHAELLRDAKSAILEFINVADARALGLREDDQTCSRINGCLCQAPHAFQIRGAPHIGNGNVAKALHEPAVRGNLEVRFQFPATDKLRNGAVQHEGVKEIDMI